MINKLFFTSLETASFFLLQFVFQAQKGGRRERIGVGKEVSRQGMVSLVCTDCYIAYTTQARERRDDKNPDYSAVEETLPSASTYRAVAPGLVDP